MVDFFNYEFKFNKITLNMMQIFSEYYDIEN